MPKILRVGAYSDIMKVLSALNVKEQEVWGLSTIILPTFSVGQSAVFERVDIVVNYGDAMSNTIWYTPKYSTYWSSLQIVNYQNATLSFTIIQDDESTRSFTLLPYEVFTFTNCRLRGIRQLSGSAINTVRIIGGY